MSILLFSNNASSTLASPISAGAVSCTLSTGEGARFPSPAANEYFIATFTDVATGLTNEIIHVTARSGDVLTIQRGQEGTAARAWNAGDNCISFVTAGTMAAMLQQGQYQQQSANYGVDTGSVNALAVTLDPAPTALSALVGAPVRVLVAHTTTSISVTLNVNGLGARNVTKTDLSSLAVGTLPIGGICEFVYDGTRFQFTGQVPGGGGGGGVTSITASSPGLTGGTITSSGTIAINPASAAQVQAGTDNLQAITSLALAGAMVASKVQNGYQKLPNGMTLQWGRFTSLSHGQVVGFPLPFVTIATLASDVGYSGSGDPWLINLSLNGSGPFTGFTVYAWQVGSGGPTPTTGAGIGWIAIGITS